MSTNPVEKGLRFEKAVEAMLKEHGLRAWRTNEANESDPARYKAGFDGGVDIIAVFDSKIHGYRDYCFFIQCKCHKEDLTKSAISEVYAGMHVRKGTTKSSIPVVIATSNASQETRQFAKDLGVELFLKNENDIIENAKAGMPIPYADYGHLVRVLLYNITKDDIWIKTLPDIGFDIPELSMKQKMIDNANADFDQAQSFTDKAWELERRAQENRQKALDIQKATVFRILQSYPTNMKQQKHSSETPTITEDSG